jgi:integrase/recombinase XerD
MEGFYMNSELVLFNEHALAEHDPQSHDLAVINMWLHGRSPNTQKTYAQAVRRFLAWADKPIVEVTLPEVQAFADSLHTLAPASQAMMLNAIRSLFKFSKEIGYLRVDVTRPLKTPKFEHRVAERILSVDEVRDMIQLEPNHRDRVILMLLYFGGLRIGELSGLKWRNLQPTKTGGQVTVFGKGGRTRSVALPPHVFAEIVSLKPEHAGYEDPVFVGNGRYWGKEAPLSERGLGQRRIQYMVRRAAERAGIDRPVSPHWLRHSHATHSLDNGAPIHLVQRTLGHASLATTEKYLHTRPGEASGNYLNLDAAD